MNRFQVSSANAAGDVATRPSLMADSTSAHTLSAFLVCSLTRLIHLPASFTQDAPKAFSRRCAVQICPIESFFGFVGEIAGSFVVVSPLLSSPLFSSWPTLSGYCRECVGTLSGVCRKYFLGGQLGWRRRSGFAASSSFGSIQIVFWPT